MATNPLHPIVGPEDYISPYSDMNYSKGPKIIYGNTDVMTVVLNDAQVDEDDEWGRTEEIAFRMIIDEAVEVHKELFGWSGILGLKDKFQLLLGFFVNFESNNFANPELTEFTIGSSILKNDQLKLGDAIFRDTNITLNTGHFNITFDSNNAILSVGGSSGYTPSESLSIQLTYLSHTNTSVIFNLLDNSGNIVNYTMTYNFFNCPGIISANEATFGTTDGGVLTGSTLTLSDSLTITGLGLWNNIGIWLLGNVVGTIKTSYVNFPTFIGDNNYIKGVADSSSPENETVSIQSNFFTITLRSLISGVETATDIVYFTKALVSTTEVITNVLNCSLNIIGTQSDLYIAGYNIEGRNHSIIHFLTYLEESKLDVYNDGTRTIYHTESASLYEFNARDLPYFRIFANDTDYGTGIGISRIGPAPEYNEFRMSLVAGSRQIGATNNIYGILFAETVDSPNSGSNFIIDTSHNNALYLTLGSPTAEYNFLSLNNYRITQYLDTTLQFGLDYLDGMSTGQGYIKWKCYNITGQTWAAGSPLSIDLTAIDVNVPVPGTVWYIGASVVEASGNVWYSGTTTYSYMYYVNPGTGSSTVIFSPPNPSDISDGTVSIRLTVFYQNSTIL